MTFARDIYEKITSVIFFALGKSEKKCHWPAKIVRDESQKWKYHRQKKNPLKTKTAT